MCRVCRYFACLYVHCSQFHFSPCFPVCHRVFLFASSCRVPDEPFNTDDGVSEHQRPICLCFTLPVFSMLIHVRLLCALPHAHPFYFAILLPASSCTEIYPVRFSL